MYNMRLYYKQASSRLIAKSDEILRTLRSTRLDGATTYAVIVLLSFPGYFTIIFDGDGA